MNIWLTLALLGVLFVAKATSELTEKNSILVTTNTQCPGVSGVSNDLVLDLQAIFVVDKNTREIKQTVVQNDKTSTTNIWGYMIEFKSAQIIRDLIGQQNSEIVAVVYLRRKSGIGSDNPIYYGWYSDHMRWTSTSKKSGSDNDAFSKKNAIHIDKLDFKMSGQPVTGVKIAFGCDDPQSWIINHGIYAISADSVRNLYYDPLRKLSKAGQAIKYLV